MSNKKSQPVRRCVVCQREVEFLRSSGLIVTRFIYGSDFIKQAIALILVEHKDEISKTVYRKLHLLRKLTDDVSICEDCVKRLYAHFCEARAHTKVQTEFRLDVKDAAPVEHLDRLRKDEASLTPAEDKAFRNLIKSLRSGEGPAGEEAGR